MARLLNVPRTEVALVPGERLAIQVAVRNDASIVDELAIDIVGEPGAWAQVEPSAVRLFPGDQATVTITFSPPRIAALKADRRMFGVRAVSREHPAGNCVEEGAVRIAPFSSFSVEISPRTSTGRREGHHDLAIENGGNVPLSAVVTARDPDRAVVVAVPGEAVVAAPGERLSLPLAVRAAAWHWRGTERPRPFSVVVEGGAGTQEAQAVFLQRPVLPGWAGQLVLAIPGFVLAAVALAALIGQPWNRPPTPTPQPSLQVVLPPAESPTAEPRPDPTAPPPPPSVDASLVPASTPAADLVLYDGFDSFADWDTTSSILQPWTLEAVPGDPSNTAACVLSYINNVSARMTRTVTLPPVTPLTIDIGTIYETEAEADSLTIWATTPGTTDSRVVGVVSGSSDGQWLHRWADLTAESGRPVELTFEFRSDHQDAPPGGGICVDFLTIVNAGPGEGDAGPAGPSGPTAATFTRAQCDAIEEGMERDRVVELLGTAGEPGTPYRQGTGKVHPYVWRNADGTNIEVGFLNDLVEQKFCSDNLR